VTEVRESEAGAVTAANVKSVMMARRRALRLRNMEVVVLTQTKMFSNLRSVVERLSVYVYVMREVRLEEKKVYVLDGVRTTVHHPVRVHERESTGELLCEGANIALRESSSIDDPVEKRLGLRYIVATPSSPALCFGRESIMILGLDVVGSPVGPEGWPGTRPLL